MIFTYGFTADIEPLMYLAKVNVVCSQVSQTPTSRCRCACDSESREIHSEGIASERTRPPLWQYCYRRAVVGLCWPSTSHRFDVREAIGFLITLSPRSVCDNWRPCFVSKCSDLWMRIKESVDVLFIMTRTTLVVVNPNCFRLWNETGVLSMPFSVL